MGHVRFLWFWERKATVVGRLFLSCIPFMLFDTTKGCHERLLRAWELRVKTQHEPEIRIYEYDAWKWIDGSSVKCIMCCTRQTVLDLLPFCWIVFFHGIWDEKFSQLNKILIKLFTYMFYITNLPFIYITSLLSTNGRKKKRKNKKVQAFSLCLSLFFLFGFYYIIKVFMNQCYDYLLPSSTLKRTVTVFCQ